MKEIIISEIQIIPVKPKEGLVAFASCVINDQFYVGDIAVYTRPDGSDYRLVFPSKTLHSGARINVFHPINREAGHQLKSQIIKVYLSLTEKVKKMKRKGELQSGNQR